MTTRKQDDPFASTALVPAGQQYSTSLAPSQRTRQLDKAERSIAGESHKQQLVIREQARKTEAAHRAIAAIHESGYREFQASADAIWAMRTPNGRDPVLQRQVDHIAAQMIQSSAGSMQAVSIQSAQLIADEINRSLHREIKEPTWLDRLRGDSE